MKQNASAILLLVCAPAIAQTIAPQTLLCESPDSIMFVKQTPFLAGKPADLVLKAADTQIKFAQIMRSSANTQGRLNADANKAEAANPPYQALLGSCASSGATALQGEVIELKAISGLAKVRVLFNGSPTTVFISSSAITP